MIDGSPKRSPRRGAAVTAVVINFNSAELSGRCVESILRQEYDPLRVIVVDSHSHESDWQRLQAVLPAQAGRIRMASNAGYATAINSGARQSIANGTGLILALNSDVSLNDAHTISRLAAVFADDPLIVAASPLVRDRDQAAPPETAIQGRRVPDWCTLLVAHSASLRRLPVFQRRVNRYLYEDARPYPLDSTVWTEMINGACFMIRSDFLEEIGYLDEGTFLYMEEHILGAQTLQRGRKAAIVTSAVVDHIQGASTGSHSGNEPLRMFRAQLESELYFLAKYAGSGVFERGLYRVVRICDYFAKKAAKTVFRSIQVARDDRG